MEKNQDVPMFEAEPLPETSETLETETGAVQMDAKSKMLHTLYVEQARESQLLSDALNKPFRALDKIKEQLGNQVRLSEIAETVEKKVYCNTTAEMAVTPSHIADALDDVVAAVKTPDQAQTEHEQVQHVLAKIEETQEAMRQYLMKWRSRKSA